MSGRNPWDELAEAERERQELAERLKGSRQRVRAAAHDLHAMGESWDSIASALGIGRQTAYERFR